MTRKPMTVADLKALLADVPNDMLVLTFNHDATAWHDRTRFIGVCPVTLYDECEDFNEYTIERKSDALTLRAFLI